MIRVFYSYSNHTPNELCVNMYQEISKYFEINEDKNIEIIDTDKSDTNDSNLRSNIFSLINGCDIFVCDITNDCIIDEFNKQVFDNTNNSNIEIYNKLHPLINSNVSIELGYALSTKNYIIYIQNKTIINKIPTLLEGIQYIKYSDINDYEEIVNKIIDYADKSKTEKGYKKFEYKLTEKSKSILNQLLDIQYFKDYYIIYNNNYKYLIMNKNGNRRQININTKKLELKNKSICLSYYTDLYNELKHIELLIEIELLKQK